MPALPPGGVRASSAGSSDGTVAPAEPVGPKPRHTDVMPLWEAARTQRLEPPPVRTRTARRRCGYWAGVVVVTLAVHLGLLTWTAKSGTVHVERVMCVGKRAGHFWESWVRGCPACQDGADRNDRH